MRVGTYTFVLFAALSSQLHALEFKYTKDFSTQQFCDNPSEYICKHSNRKVEEKKSADKRWHLFVKSIKPLVPDYKTGEGMNDICARKWPKKLEGDLPELSILKQVSFDRVKCAELTAKYLKKLEANIESEMGMTSSKKMALVNMARQTLLDGVEDNKQLPAHRKRAIRDRILKMPIKLYSDVYPDITKRKFEDEKRTGTVLFSNDTCGNEGLADNGFVWRTNQLIICPGAWVDLAVKSADFGEMRKLAADLLLHEFSHGADGGNSPQIWNKFNECSDMLFPEFVSTNGIENEDEAQEFQHQFRVRRRGEISADYLQAEALGNRFVNARVDRGYAMKIVGSSVSRYCDDHEGGGFLSAPDTHLTGKTRIDFIVKGNDKMRKALGCDKTQYNSCDFLGNNNYTFATTPTKSTQTKPAGGRKTE